MSIERDWARSNERDYFLTVRNHFLAHDHVETATEIDYPQVGQENAAVDIESVPAREDLLKLIDGESIRDKAMYTVLWESGNRVTALAALKVKHWKSKGDGYGVIQVPGRYVTGLKGAEHSAKLIWLLFQPLHTVENVRSAENLGDYHILQTVAEGNAQTISSVADHLDYQEDDVSDRCYALQDQQALTFSDGELELTETGREYLHGEGRLPSG